MHATARWTVRYIAATDGHELGLDRNRIALGGFSSGGGRAASVCPQARDSGSFRAVLQVLGVRPSISPANCRRTHPG